MIETIWRPWLLAGTAAVLVAVAFVYLADMRRAYARVARGSDVVRTIFGDVEYAVGGSGPPVLVVHGSGGGYDQAELIAEAVLGNEFRWIAPSRFGYLRSSLPVDATFDDQAHAYAALLDRLGVDRVAVVAMSHGGPSALLFAALHPERVASLTLLSCGVAPAATAEQSAADRKGRLLTALYRFDLPYWLVSKLLRKPFMRLIGADAAAVAAMTPAELDLVHLFIDRMNPASQRRAGVGFDNRAALPGERIRAVKSPTLIVHARDDSLQLYRNAEFAAATISQSSLLAFERGGHLVIAAERARIRDAVGRHVRAHTGAAEP